MRINSIYAWCIFALYLPFLAIVLILVHYFLARVRWRRRKRRGQRRLGFCPSTFALGMAFQFMQIYHRPSMAYVLEAKQDQDADEDNEGDPETVAKQLGRQLRRIRRGEWVERLVLRL